MSYKLETLKITPLNTTTYVENLPGVKELFEGFEFKVIGKLFVTNMGPAVIGCMVRDDEYLGTEYIWKITREIRQAFLKMYPDRQIYALPFLVPGGAIRYNFDQ